MNLKNNGFALFFLTMLLVFVSCHRETHKIKVGYLPITLSLPFFVAIEQGYFEEAGLEIEPVKYTTADQLTNALAANNIDVTANTSTSTFLKVNDNLTDFAKIYLISIHTPENYLDALLVGEKSPITSIPQLVHKKIGVYPGSTNVIYLKIALSNYIDPESVEMIQLPLQTHIEALASNQIDALYTLEPLVTLAVMKGIGRELIKGSNSTYLVNPFPGGVYLASNNYAQANKKTLNKFIIAINKAVDFINTNPKLARSFYPKYTPIDSLLAQKVKIGSWWTLSQIETDKVDSLIKILLKYKYIENYPKNNIYFKVQE